MSDNCVLQEWTQSLSWKKQTVLLTAIRAPDTLTTLQIKQITVWLRAVILKDADPMTGFMHGALRGGLPRFEQIDREFERLPLHCAHHLILAIQVIAFDHPDEQMQREAGAFYNAAVEAQHLNLETPSQYERRMTDNPARITEAYS